MPSNTKIHQSNQSMAKHVPMLPSIGKSRWSQLKHFIPVCRETWRQLYKANKAPQPQYLSARCTVWDNAEIHQWLQDLNTSKVVSSPQNIFIQVNNPVNKNCDLMRTH
jgi:prophage regulatory protein